MKIIAALTALALLAGCAGFDATQPLPPHQETVAKLAVQVGALRVLKTPEKAKRAVVITASLSALVASDNITALDQLEAALRAQVDLNKLKPEERLLLNAVVGGIKIEAARLMGSQEIATPGNKARIVKILGWVTEAAEIRLAAGK